MISKNELILIIGASGFLGSKLYSCLSIDNNVIGTYFSRPMKNLRQLDVSDQKAVESFLQTIHPNVIIDCGGMTRPDICESDKKRAYQVNVQGVRNIMHFTSSKIIYFSTDYVFDGQKGFYSEEDKPNPINHYGWTKHEAEKIILAAGTDNVVIRVSGIYGHNPNNNEFLSSLEKTSTITRACDCYSSNILMDDIINNIDFFKSTYGLFHLTDNEALSRSEFAVKAINILNLSTVVVEKPAKELYTIAKRPNNSSLITKKHNLEIHNSDEGLWHIKRQLNSEV